MSLQRGHHSYNVEFQDIGAMKKYFRGALVVQKSSAHVLEKAYFGGGTVQIATRLAHVQKTDISDRFEDGTIPYLDIMALNSGFESWNRISGGTSNITSHTFALAKYVYMHLKQFRHGNGLPVARLYEDTGYVSMATQGPIIAFNLLRPDGAYIGCSQVEKLAQACNLHWRVGCFCNMGACQVHLGLSDEQIWSNYKAGHVCGDDMDLIDGKPTGAIRVSFGYTSTLDDANSLLDFLRSNYITDIENVRPLDSANILNNILRDVQQELQSNIKSTNRLRINGNNTFKEKTCDVKKGDSDTKGSVVHKTTSSGPVESKVKMNYKSSKMISSDEPIYVKEICLYPVKSCAAFKVRQWPLYERGLLYDRQWMVISSSGAPLLQTRQTQMCLIHPFIDRETQTLTLKFAGLPDIQVPLDMSTRESRNINICQQKLCGDWVSVLDCGDEVASWLEEALCRPGVRLVQQLSDSMRTLRPPAGVPPGGSLSLVNHGQYLLVNEESVKQLQTHILDTAVLQSEENHLPMENLVDRFRGNIVISAKPNRIEESWCHLRIGDIEFFNIGTCTRCQMVCVDPTDGSKSRQPLTAINATRGKLEFGILLQHQLTNQVEAPTLNVGDQLFVIETK